MKTIKILFWVLALVLVGSMVDKYMLAPGTETGAESEELLMVTELEIEGMTWPGWAGALLTALEELDGVSSTELLFDEALIKVKHDNDKVSGEVLAQTINDLEGDEKFTAKVRPNK